MAIEGFQLAAKDPAAVEQVYTGTQGLRWLRLARKSPQSRCQTRDLLANAKDKPSFLSVVLIGPLNNRR